MELRSWIKLFAQILYRIVAIWNAMKFYSDKELYKDMCEGMKVRTTVLAELVFDERVVAFFAIEGVAKERSAMHALLWNSSVENFQSKDYQISVELFEKLMLYVPHDIESRILRAKGYRVLCLLPISLSQLDRAKEYILKLFEADMYKPEEFEEAITGCNFVFHVATPLSHTKGYKFANRIEATVATAKSICFDCIRSGTMTHLIYTDSVIAASPLKNKGHGYKDFMDETCWTPLNFSVAYNNDSLKDYTDSKTLAEQEILNFANNRGAARLEVVTIACGLVGRETYHLSYTSIIVLVCLSQLTNDEVVYHSLKFLEELLGKVPIVHIEDVCDARVFFMETSSVTGRFLCTSSYVSTAEIAKYYHESYPKFNLKEEYLKGPRRNIEWCSKKLLDFSLNLEDKVLSKGGGNVMTIGPMDSFVEDQNISEASPKPRRSIRARVQPAHMRDYVSNLL